MGGFTMSLFLADSSTRRSQRGGITILVSLLMLVLLTISALAMSRNSFREIVASGTIRQGAMARNLADSGIEYGVLWILNDPAHPPSTTANQSAVTLQNLCITLSQGNLFGTPYKLNGTAFTTTNTSAPPSDLQVPSGSGNGFNLSVTAMGSLAETGNSTTGGSTLNGVNRQSGNMPKTAPTIWAVRSDGVYNAAGVMTFTHSKEAWISTRPMSAN
jgi:Tfp pilus assembly protein PilX